MGRFKQMTSICRMAALRLACVLLALISVAGAAHAAEMRFALVVGNDEYKGAKLATPANDAGLVADALTAAGFTVTGARNLDQATLRESFREFVAQVAQAGPDAVAVVYLGGFGVQFAGENYFVPVDADLARDVDVPLQAVRVSDFTQPLAALPGRVKLVILDAARQNPFARGGQPLAGGLALVEPGAGLAMAFNAAPGTVGPDEAGPYGAYATSLTEMIAAGGLSLDDVFARVRLRVSELTSGGEVPWYASQIDGPFFFTERSADAPPPPNVAPVADVRGRALNTYGDVDDAYAAALTMDTMEGYEQFLALYPSSPYAQRVAVMLAVRREEIIWRHCVIRNTPQAYWSYLRRYPDGPHVWDARRRLAMIGAAFDAPPDFAFYDFGVPPPPPAELVFLNQPVLVFWGPAFRPPPPPPPFFLPPRPREFAALPPPPPAHERFFLPTPAAAVIPAFVRPPRTVAVRPQPPGGGTPDHTQVSLPGAVQRGVTGSHPGTSATAPAVVTPPGHPGAPAGSQLPTAAVKPGTPPNPPAGTAPSAATVKPSTLPSPPPNGTTPSTATIKPSTPPPPHVHEGVTPGETHGAQGSAPSTATIKSSTPPPHVHEGVTPGETHGAQGSAPSTATIKPSTPPPHVHEGVTPGETQGGTHGPAPSAAAIKPVTPPPPPPPPPAAPAAAAVKPPPPPPPPPHPAAPAAAKPSCPPGKTLAQVNGQPTCK
jgi:uncharacterized caspase-like protein